MRRWRAPGRREAQQWRTLHPSKRVLAVARNLTSTTRLLDVLPLIETDRRIEVVFTINEGSAFADGLSGFLGDLEAKVVPWKQAVRSTFDLAIAANINAGLRRLSAPLMVLPHGAGYNRLVEASTGDRVSAAGLSRKELLYRGQVIPTVIGLSHEEQLSRLRRSCRPAADRARVIGDPCYDRIVASVPRRERYRRALGVGEGRKLVVVTSTWFEHSLLAGCPDLPERLVAQLPIDEYQVAVVAHPNVWSWHSPYTVRGWLRDAMDAGVLVVPPREGWRAALIAADWVIGDHGSVTFYGAALDRCTLLAASGEDDLDPASPTAEFVGRAPRLDPHTNIRTQLEGVAAAHHPGRHRHVTDRTLGIPGESGRVLRDTLYTLMDLTPPATEPRVRPLPLPQPERGEEVTAFLVSAAVEDPADTVDTVTVWRFPAIVEGYHRAEDVVDAFLAVDVDELDRGLLESAEILIRRDPWALESAPEWTARTLARYPGAGLAAASVGDTRCVLRLRDGRLLDAEVTTPRLAGQPARCDPVLVASGVSAWLPAVRAIEPRSRLRVRTGSTETIVHITLVDGTPRGV